jgi:hypothetical protein
LAGWPVAVGLQAFGARERPSEQVDLPLNLDRSRDAPFKDKTGWWLGFVYRP